MLLSAITMGLVSPDALAHPDHDRNRNRNRDRTPDNGLSILAGTASGLDGNPASLRLSLRGEVGTGRNALLGASLLLPITLTVQGTEGLGLDPAQSLLELPISFRGRILPGSPVRLYADAGIGAAVGTSAIDGWRIGESDTSVVAMTRTALGLEIGNPDRFMAAIEPMSWSTYFTSDRIRARYGLMVGLNVTL